MELINDLCLSSPDFVPKPLAHLIDLRYLFEPDIPAYLALREAIEIFLFTFKSEIDLFTGNKVTVIVTNTPNLSFLLDKNACGIFIPLILLPCHLWEEYNLSHVAMMVCVLEELCHYFYAISDEELIKVKVKDVFMKARPKSSHDWEMYLSGNS